MRSLPGNAARTRLLQDAGASSIVMSMGLLMTGLISLVGVNIVLGAARLWRRSVEARMVRQVRAWPGFDVYHADLLSAGEPLCVTAYQPGRLEWNSYRATDVAIRLMRQDGLLHEDRLELVETAAEPIHPVTAACFRVIGRYRTVSRPSPGDIGRDPDVQSAVRAHLAELFAHAPATRRHPGTTVRETALWAYAVGAAAPAVHTYFLMSSSAPGDPDVRKGSFVLACLVFLAALIVLTAQAGNTWHPLEDPGPATALQELSPPRTRSERPAGVTGDIQAADTDGSLSGDTGDSFVGD